MRTPRGSTPAGGLLACLLALAPAPGGPAGAAEPGAARPGEGRLPPEPEAGSPRTTVRRFLELTRAGKYAEAANLLDLSPGGEEEGAERARQLRAVLDRHLWIDLDDLSASPEGNTADGLPPDRDDLGLVPGPWDKPEPVRLARRAAGGAPRWLFSRATVERVPEWYQALGNRWALEHLPEPLLRAGPKGLQWWQWLALSLLALAVWGLGTILGRATRALIGRAAARAGASWGDAATSRVGGPLTLGWALLLAALLVDGLGLHPPAAAAAERGLRAGLAFALFWSLLRLVDIVGASVGASSWARARPESRSLLPIAGRMAKVLVLAMAVVAVLSELGFSVASLVTGLGIGGLAVALAAQKTVENLFGAVSLGLDQPIREGDFVRIEDVVGTVEKVGLRSTRIRTLDRTLVTLPNGKLSEMRLESFSARDRMRLACDIGIVYGTTAGQMRQVLAGLERVLRSHPRIWPDAVVVRLKQFGASSLDIEVMAWFQTPEWSEFQLIRQEVLLQFMEVVDAAGTSFAFPTRTVHLVPGAGPAPGA
jgi:MscS family membrane protein